MDTMPETPDPDRRARLLALVEEGLDLAADGFEIDLDVLCREHPDLKDAVADALSLRRDIQDLQKLAGEVDPLLGTAVSDRYRLERRLGMGAMGAVYGATDLQLKRQVAVKVLHDHAQALPNTEQRFAREVETLADLAHPNILAIHDCGRSRGTLYLVTDLLQGRSLAEVLDFASEQARAIDVEQLFEDSAWIVASLATTELPEQNVLRLVVGWIADIGRALAAAHAANVLHRDVKPSNIFIRRDGTAVLLDFGLARRVGDATLTAADSPIGTPLYMAPEQASGIATDPTVDVYGLTATLYHLVTLRAPFEGSDLPDLLMRIQRDDPTPARKVRPGLPRDLEAILDRGLERDAARRYPSMQAFVDDLSAFLEHRPVSARPLSRPTRAWRRIRRQPARALAVVGAAVALLAVSIALPLWLDARSESRRTEREALLRTIPALLAIEGDPDRRLLVPVEERTRDVDVLSRILELDPDDLPIRVLRAALFVDRGRAGDPERAAEDFDWLATQTESAYVREVAARYAAMDPDARGALSVDLASLENEPNTPAEHFVAGFHELRNRHLAGFAERALAHLDVAAEDYLPARDLRLLALLGFGEHAKGDARPAAYRKARDEALWLEGHYGHPTARTRATIGAALLALGDYERAIEPLQESNELRPDRHGPVHNLGVAYHRRGFLDEAEAQFVHALTLRPWLWNTRYHLAHLYAERGEYDEAIGMAKSLDFSARPAHAWRRPFALGNVALFEALEVRRQNDFERTEECGEAALARYDKAAELAPEDYRKLVAVSRQVVHAIRSDDMDTAMAYHLALLAGDPLNPTQIGNLAKMVEMLGGERGLGPLPTRQLRKFLSRLQSRLAPGLRK